MIVLGDIHADWKYLQKVINIYPGENIFCLGEFGYWPKYEEFSLPDIKNNHVYFIDGNHEDFWSLRDNGYLNADCPQEIHKNIFYVPRGISVDIEGKKIVCCGGGKSIDKNHRTLGKSWFPEEEINYLDIHRCITTIENNKDIDYIFTHVAPSEFKVETEINILPLPKSTSEKALDGILNYIMEMDNKISGWFFAHYHQSANSFFQETFPWKCLGLGEIIEIR